MPFEETWMDLKTIIQKVRKRKTHHIDGKKKEGIYVYIQLIHFAIQEKITEHYKATLRQ